MSHFSSVVYFQCWTLSESRWKGGGRWRRRESGLDWKGDVEWRMGFPDSLFPTAHANALSLIFLTFCDFFFFLLPIVHSFTLSHSRALTHTSQIRSAAPGASFSRPRNQTVKQSCPYSRSWHIPSCVLYFWAQIPLTVLVCVCVQLTLRNSLQPLGLYRSMFAWCCIQAKQGPLGLLYVCVSMAFLCVTSNKWDAFVFGLLCLVPVLSCTPCMFISCQF